jgi:hypothetical protein
MSKQTKTLKNDICCFFAKHEISNFSVISWREQVNFQWDDDEVRFVLDQHA